MSSPFFPTTVVHSYLYLPIYLPTLRRYLPCFLLLSFLFFRLYLRTIAVLSIPFHTRKLVYLDSLARRAGTPSCIERARKFAGNEYSSDNGHFSRASFRAIYTPRNVRVCPPQWRDTYRHDFIGSIIVYRIYRRSECNSRGISSETASISSTILIEERYAIFWSRFHKR